VLSNLFNRNGVGQAAAGGAARGERHGDRWPQVYPGGILPCADGYVSFVTLLTKHWDRYAEAIGRADLLENPRYNVRNGALPEDARAELDAIQVEWLRQRTRAELFEFFQQIRVPFQPVHSISELLDESHLERRGFWEPLAAGEATLKVPAAPSRRVAHGPGRVES
jgi:crotonobetainyl-CoA:carnitine CoA-transferase CaiB-like acyl-CoA transferase